MKRKYSLAGNALALVAAASFATCVQFQPTTPAVGTADYTPTAMVRSATMSDSSIHYDAAGFKAGASRSQVQSTFGDPNATRTTDRGQVEDVYAFNEDGTKFVNPEVRPRNLALGFFTMAASVAVRQARLALNEKKLTLYHVLYAPDDTIQSVREEKMSDAPDSLPNATPAGIE